MWHLVSRPSWAAASHLCPSGLSLLPGDNFAPLSVRTGFVISLKLGGVGLFSLPPNHRIVRRCTRLPTSALQSPPKFHPIPSVAVCITITRAREPCRVHLASWDAFFGMFALLGKSAPPLQTRLSPVIGSRALCFHCSEPGPPKKACACPLFSTSW